MNARLTFVHALSSLHAGTGQGAGVIDLPIAREKATGLPFLPGSSLKGALRALCNVNECIQVFGPDTSEIDPNNNQASAAQFSDQRLLLLPIRSLAGTFAWVTSPYVLLRFARDMKDIHLNPSVSHIPNGLNNEQCYVATVDSERKIVIGNKVYLEDLDLQAQTNQDVENWAAWIAGKVFPGDTVWQQMLIERFCLVHDDVFNFILNTATEITARIKLKEDSKTVQDGGLWYEESLPTETILSGLVLATPVKASAMTPEKVFDVLNSLTGKAIQLGGKATVGQGMCQVQLVKGEA